MRAAPIPGFSRNWENAYLQFQTEDLERLNGFIGIQYNKVPDVKGKWVFRGGLNWTIDAQSGIKLLWGEAFRAAYSVETNFDLVVCCDADGNNRGGLRGNPGLEPEEIETLEVQYYSNNEQTHWALTGFRSELTNLIGRTRAADRVLDFINTGSLDSWGLEWEMKHFFSADLQLDAAFTWQKNEAHGKDDYTLMPDWLLKIGMSKTFASGSQISAFLNAQDAFHSNTIRSPNAQPVNPEADSRFELTLHYRHPLNWLSDAQSVLSIYVTNALDDELYQPDIAGGSINTHPAGAGRQANIGLSVIF
ncbi:TonB-dependent receptor [Planctobacterium marinum]